MSVRPASLLLGPLGVLLGVLLVVACAGPRHAALDDELRQDAARSLWQETAAPLTAATLALGDALPRVDHASAVFTLTANGAQRREDPVRADDLCRADVAVFFHLHQHGTLTWWRFDPRGAVLVPVATQDQFIRLLPTGWSSRRLELHRYDIAITDDHIAITGHARLGDDDIRDAVIAGSDVVCLRRDGERTDPRERLIAIPLTGGPARELIESDETVSAPFAMADGSVLIALGQPGAQQAWRLDPVSGERSRWTAALPTSPGADFVLGVDDDLAPRVLHLSDQLDLATVLALTEARDPAINRRRALLAAALAESGQLQLAPLPNLQLGFDYTPVDGILVDPIGSVGDVLAAGLMRGVVGLVMPLFDLPRRRLAAEAGTIRVAIASDLLSEEIQQRVADAAKEWCLFQHYQARLALDQELLDNADRAIARIRRQRSAGVGSEADLLLAQHQRTTAATALGDSERRRDQHRDSLRRRCGIASGAAFALMSVALPAESRPVPSRATVERAALLNRPRLIAARRLAEETFFVGESGKPGWSGGPSASYGQVRSDEDGSAVNDYLSLRLDASIPLHTRGAGRLNAERNAALVAAQRAAADEATSAVRRDASAAWTDTCAALATLDASAAERRWREEQLRLARLWDEHGGPDAEIIHRVRDADVADYDRLRAAVHASERARDAALALVHLGRVMGADRLHLVALIATSAEPSVTEPPSTGLDAPLSIDPEGETRP